MDISVPFLTYFSRMEDMRVPGMVLYPLEEILFLTLCGVLCGFDDFDETVMWGQEQLDWLRKFLPYSNGIPKAKTLRLVLNHLDAKAFEISFESWTSSLSKELKGVIAIDGKTVCGSKKGKSGSGATHIVSAFAHDLGIVIAQEKVTDKSNEITAIPELLKRLTLAGTVVTIDAMGTQKEISKVIIEQKADYILALKKNHSDLYDDASTYFSKIDKCEIYDEFEDTDYGHGRIEIRNCKVISDISWLQGAHGDWTGMRSIVKVEATRIEKKTKDVSNETRYYISSLTENAEKMLRYVRSHWSVENKLHWQLDITFREDSCRIRQDHGAQNLSLIRRIALNILQKNDAKLPIKRRKVKALIDSNYRTKLIIS